MDQIMKKLTLMSQYFYRILGNDNKTFLPERLFDNLINLDFL